MTNIGQTLCLVCGQISCEQVFYYSTLNVAITVAKNWRNQYAAFASTSDGKTLFVQLHEKPTIDKDTGTILKLKLGLAVRGNNTPCSVTLHARNRICPHCLRKGHITQLPPLAGQAPTFYIGLLGLPSVGKSVLLNAAFTGKVVSILSPACMDASWRQGYLRNRYRSMRPSYPLMLWGCSKPCVLLPPTYRCCHPLPYPLCPVTSWPVTSSSPPGENKKTRPLITALAITSTCLSCFS